MHARCGYMGTAKPKTVFVDLNDVSRKLKPLSRHPVQFVSMKYNALKKINTSQVMSLFSISPLINQSISFIYQYKARPTGLILLLIGVVTYWSL